MAITLQDIFNEFNDYRIDDSDDMLDENSEGLRMINRSLRILQRKHDWVDKQQIITYNKGITEYALNSDYKVNSPISLSDNAYGTRFSRVTTSDFEQSINRLGRMPDVYAEKTIGQNKRLNIGSNIGETFCMDSMTVIVNNGTWSVVDDALNLIQDDTFFKGEFGSSLKYDINGTVATIKNTTLNNIDLSSVEGLSGIYLQHFIPTTTNLTSIEIKFGSDESNYWTTTVTTDYIGDTFLTNSWNQLKANWDTKTGSPDSSDITFIQIKTTYSSTTSISGLRVNDMFASKDVDLLFWYYSENMVNDITGSTEAKIFDGTDLTDTLIFLDDNMIDAITAIITTLANYQQEDGIETTSFNKSLETGAINGLMQKYPSKRDHVISFMRAYR